MQNQTPTLVIPVHDLNNDCPGELRAKLVAERVAELDKAIESRRYAMRGMRSDDLIAEMRMRGILAERKRLQRQIRELRQISKTIDTEFLFSLIDREDSARRREAVLRAIAFTEDALDRNAVAMKSPVTSPIAFIETPTALLETESRMRKQARDRQRMAQGRSA